MGQKAVNSTHKNPRTGEGCQQKELNYPFHLGHIFETDVRAIGFSAAPPPFPDAENQRERDAKLEGFLRTLAETVRIAAADLLEADSRDIRASKELRDGRPLIVLSDAVAGGAGYVQRLFEDPDFSARSLIDAAIRVVDCRRSDCATSCAQCLNDYSNQTYWDVFDRLPVLEWLHALLSDVTDRPTHAPETAIPVKTLNYAGLEEHMRGASALSLCATTIQGARDADRAQSAAKLIRDFCEADQSRIVRFFVCSGLPLSQTPLSTIDRDVIDTLTRFEDSGQLEVFLIPRDKLEKAPRISIRKGDKCSEFYANNFDQPIFDDLLGAPMHVATVSEADSLGNRDGDQSQKIQGALSVIALNTSPVKVENPL
jgi:hypothetical protein